MRHPPSTLALAFALALALAGCGSSTSNTSSSTTARSPTGTTTTTTTTTTVASVLPAGFSHSAETICIKRNKALVTVGLSVDSEKELKHVAHGRAIVEHNTLNELQKLTPPSTLQDEWKAFLAARQAVAKAWNELSEHGVYNLGKKGSAESRLTPVTAAQKKMLTAAKHLSLTECTQEN
jgi:hypothetical protein